MLTRFLIMEHAVTGNQVRPFIFIVFIFIVCSIPTFTLAETISDPCGGTYALLAMVNRPSNSDSACAVKNKKIVTELGYQYQILYNVPGHQQNFPETEFRFGLPFANEFDVLLPDFIQQSVLPHAGLTATAIGLKHELGYNQNWLGAIEGYLIPPSGSDAFGSHRVGVVVNGIVTYAFTSTISASFLLGVSTIATTPNSGSIYFTSINPDLLASWEPIPRLSLYGEVYGQTKTAPNLGGGYNFDGGIIYLLRPYLTIDAEIGHRLNGLLGGFDHYVGTGLAIEF